VIPFRKNPNLNMKMTKDLAKTKLECERWAMERMDTPHMQSVKKLLWMWMNLEGDVLVLEKNAKSEKSKHSFYRRQYVRAAAALIEGFTSMLKQTALLNPEHFLPEELLLLREEEPGLKDNGQLHLRKRFLAIEMNIRFAFTAYAKVGGVRFSLDCSRSGWQCFKKLFSVRDRITHPKKDEDLSISDTEMSSIKQALDFVSENHRAVLDAGLKKSLLDGGLPEVLCEKWKIWTDQMCRTKSARDRDALADKFQEECFRILEQRTGIG